MNSREEDILNEFKNFKDYLKSWGDFVDGTLKNKILPEMIERNLIKILPSYRLKEDKSYLFKALYRKKNYPNPIENIEDKVGTRIVVLKSDDIKLIHDKIIEFQDWIPKLTKDTNQEIEDKPKIFDYQSVHIVVKPKEDESKFPKDVLPILTCEIQIRTLLQHAFAEVSHDSTYKGPYKNDKDILRRLAKAMALMEATDDYFCNIFKLMSDQERYYSQYLNELISLFRNYNSGFEKKELDHFLTESIFELIEYKNISINDIEIFINKHDQELSKYILPKNGILFQQPVILIILYYFYNHRNFLKDQWTLNHDSLKSIYYVTGTSYNDY